MHRKLLYYISIFIAILCLSLTKSKYRILSLKYLKKNVGILSCKKWYKTILDPFTAVIKGVNFMDDV